MPRWASLTEVAQALRSAVSWDERRAALTAGVDGTPLEVTPDELKSSGFAETLLDMMALPLDPLDVGVMPKSVSVES